MSTTRSTPRRRLLRRVVLGLLFILLVGVLVCASVAWYLHPAFDHRRGIVYSQRHGHDLTFDVLSPGRAHGLGVVLINSGGWRSNPDGFRPWLAAPLLRCGFTVFVVSHLSQPEATVPEIIEDMHRAVRFIRHHATEYAIDPTRLGVTGGSAGGHLSLMLATRGASGPADAPDPVDRETSAVQAVAIFFPVTDLLNLGSSTENAGDGGPPRSFVRAFGPDSTNLARWKVIGRDCSPIYHVGTNLPPILIHHGDVDTLTPLEQSQWFANAVRKQAGSVELVVHHGGKHGWWTMLWDIRLFAGWFDRHLRQGEFGVRSSKFEARGAEVGDRRLEIGDRRSSPLSATSPVNPASSPPNILFAIADDWGRHAGAYGTPWITTPAFDRVAREGILFTHAYTPNAKCAPSRACILTGRNPWQLEAAANHICYFPTKFKGWAEALAEKGCFVGCTAKGWGPGVATNSLGQPRQMTGRPFNARKSKPPTRGISPNDYAANFKDFLDAAPPGKPWAFWFGALEPHRGYEFGSGAALGGKRLGDIDRVPSYWPDNETVRNDMLDYAFEVEHFDRHLGAMIAELENRGLLDNTLVVATSDHGMPFPRVKGQVYEHANHVPLAAMWPRGIRKPGRVVEDFVSFIDLAPTFIELAGLSWSQTGMAPTPGRSLTDIFHSTQSGLVNATRDHVLLGRERQDIGRPDDAGYPVRGILTRRFLYLRNFKPDRWPSGNPETGYLDCDGGATKSFILDAHRHGPDDLPWKLCFGKRDAEELYDPDQDPDCVRNLAADPAFAQQRLDLSQRLTSRLQTEADPRVSGTGDVFDTYPYANPAQRGFYERYRRGERPQTGWVNDTDFEPEPW